MKNGIWGFISAILLVVVVLLILNKCEGYEPVSVTDIEAREDSIKTLKKSEIENISRQRQLTEKLVSMEEKDSLSSLAYDNKLRSLQNKLRFTKGRVDTVFLNDPVLDSTFMLYDSVSLTQEQRIEQLEVEKDSLIVTYDSLLTVKDEQIKVKANINTHMDFVTAQLREDSRTDKRKLRNTRIGAGLLSLATYLIGRINKN
jgi:hypothetical protein